MRNLTHDERQSLAIVGVFVGSVVAVMYWFATMADLYGAAIIERLK